MAFYEAIPDSWHYLAHLGWLVIALLLQWLVGWKIIRNNLRAVVMPTLLLGTYLILTDVVAIAYGVWFFDPAQILGLYLWGVPVEEVLFFYLTALLVAQSFVLFLPGRYRYG